MDAQLPKYLEDLNLLVIVLGMAALSAQWVQTPSLSSSSNIGALFFIASIQEMFVLIAHQI
jgi:hypothetical protein